MYKQVRGLVEHQMRLGILKMVLPHKRKVSFEIKGREAPMLYLISVLS